MAGHLEFTIRVFISAQIAVSLPQKVVRNGIVGIHRQRALQRSHGSIQKCYQVALKNNATLQSRSVTLNIEVQYKSSGEVSNSSFSPRIDASFDQCMSAVAKRWTLPAMPRSVAFNYTQTLTPE